MIVADRKPIEEISNYLDGHKKILVLGCGTCVSVCLAGGERETAQLAAVLRLGGRKKVDEETLERQCDEEFFADLKQRGESCDAVLSLACGVGVQMAARVFSDKPVYPALNTRFMGTNDGAGEWSENCLACGDCKLGVFGGVCPVTRCSKSLSNGPCGGSANGMCEVDPENIECGWQLIYDRLKAIGNVAAMTPIAEPRDWTTTHSGGPRTLSREDVAGL